MNSLCAALILLMPLSPAASAGEKHDDFNSIVKRIEEHYGKTHMKVPLMGLVSLASHFTRPAGASDFKLAIIEGVGARSGELPDFNPGEQWRAVIRTTSRNGEHFVMFGRDEGHAIKTLLLTVNDEEAVVMQMRLDVTHFAKMLADKARGDGSENGSLMRRSSRTDY